VLTANLSRSSAAASVTLTGTGVAPILSLSSNAASYFLVGKGTGITVTATNTGNGNLDTRSGTAVTNLRGTFSAGTGLTGSSSTVSLNDSHYTGSATTVSNVGFTITPTSRGTLSATVLANFANGTPTTNASSSATLTFTGTGVAPVQSVTQSGLNYVRVGTSGTSSVTVSNIGDGDLAAGGSGATANNLNGSVSNSLGSGVTASTLNPSALGLGDSHGTIATSSVLTYTYAPTSRTGGSISSTVTLAFTDGNANGSNTAQTVSSVLLNQGVGPVYTSVISSTGQTVTPTPVANGSVGSASGSINLGNLAINKSSTIYLTLENTTADSLAAASLTNLSIERFSIAGSNAARYAVSLVGGTITGNTFTGGNTIAAGGSLELAITVTSNATTGPLPSTLTIFTDESVALGGQGDTFTYQLTAYVPEPATLAVLGAGLAGLASVRRRRQRA